MVDPEQGPVPGERNRAILRRTLSAISVLYGAWSLLVGWSFLALPPKGEGLHGSRFLGILSLIQAAIYLGAGGTLWKPRRPAWILTLVASLVALALAALDLAGGRIQTAPTDGIYALVALAIYLQVRPRPL